MSDSLISEIGYKMVSNEKEIYIVLECMNVLNNYNFELVKFYFYGVVSFRFIERARESSTFINTALLKKENGIITFDFFSLIYGEGRLEEDEDSDLLIKCKYVNYALCDVF